MTDSSPAPDDTLLCRFLLGQLSGAERDHVTAYLDQHPSVAASLDALRTDDTEPLAALVARLAALRAGAVPLATAGPDETGDATVSAPVGTSSHAETVDPDDDPEADVRRMLDASDRPTDLGRLGRYRVLRVLGRGGMGVVYEAEDDTLKRRVALKAMLPSLARNASARKRFVREAEAAAKVEHDNIVPIYDIADANGVPFLAMPLLVGETLDDRLKTRAPLAVADVLLIGRHVAEGLGAAHAAGLIHRDIKPSNVWLERTPAGAFKRARILDFGLARLVRDGGGLTHSGAVMGTPAYMAPEQARGQVVDHRADLFSLGGVLYQMATGRRPFRGEDTLAVLSSLANDTPPSPISLNAAVPAALSALIDRLLSKNPADRLPPTAQEVADELARIAADPHPAFSGSLPVVLPIPPRAEEVWSAVTSTATEADDVPMATATESPSARRRGGRGPLYLALAVLLGTVGLVAALFGGTIIRIATDKGELIIETDDPNIEVRVVRGDAVVADKDKGREWVLKAGAGEVTFLDPDSGATGVTKTFQITRGGKTVVRATMADVVAARPKPNPKQPAEGKSDPDRRAAEYTLSIGGAVQVNEITPALAKASELPAEPFRLTHIHLTGNKNVTDAGLAVFKDCTNLTGLRLGDSSVSDAGLAHFVNCKNLTFLQLYHTRMTDEGLAYFKDCKDLTHLSLHYTSVGDPGLAHLKDCKKLGHLRLEHTQVSDAGLAHIKDFKISGGLMLEGTRVSDAGLAHIKNCANLSHLRLQKTKVTKAGVEKLAAARPDMRIEYDGGVIEPTTGKPIDVLALVDVKRDAVSGRWGLQNGMLFGGAKVPVEPHTEMLQVPYTPPAEYDVVLVVKRLAIVNSDEPHWNPSFALTLTGPGRFQAVFDWHLSSEP